MQKIYKSFLSLLSVLLLSTLFTTPAYASDSPYGFIPDEELESSDVLKGPVLVGDEYTVFDLLSRANPWRPIGPHWYFYVGAGRVHGWALYRNNWYFLHRVTGRMQVGWIEDGPGYWYFLNSFPGQTGRDNSRPDGAMLTGWRQVSNHWYFLNPASGAGHTAGRPEGVMLTGWRFINGNYFFLNPFRGQANHNAGRPEGAMFSSGVFVINGVQQNFNASGHWIGQVSAPTNNITMSFNSNHGFVSPMQITTRANAPLPTLPTPTRSGRQFIDWFNVNAIVGGRRFRTGSTAPNSNATLWARWTEPSRHFPYWRWRPAYTGVTIIPINTSTVPADWITYVNRGIANWNQSSANVYFRVDNRDNNFNHVSIQYGLTSSPEGLGRLVGQNYTRYDDLRGFTVQLSIAGVRIHLLDNPTHTRGNVIENVMTHELGHIVGLRDGNHTCQRTGHHTPTIGGCPDCSIMNLNRNRNIRRLGNNRIPTDFDTMSANMIYGN